ncbi:peptidase C48, SUMO/sentrin/Ubl1 [Tanacetum coccineum]
MATKKVCERVRKSMIEEVHKYGDMKQTGVSLRYMLEFGSVPSDRNMIIAAQFLHKELPIRIARRAVELILPFWFVFMNIAVLKVKYGNFLNQIRVNDIARILVGSKEINFLFKVNFLTLFTNTMCKVDGLKGEICLDVVKRLRENTVISQIDWCGYVYDCLRDSKLPNGTNNNLGPLTFLILDIIKSWTSYLMKQRQELELKKHVVGLLPINSDWTKAEMEEAEGFIVSAENSEKEKAEEKLSLICAERVLLKEYIRKARLENPGDGKFIGLHEKYFNLFKDPISFEDDGNGNNVGDDDDGNGDDDANDGDGNVDENDANECDKNPNGSNQSFGFNKISLDDFVLIGSVSGSPPLSEVEQGRGGQGSGWIELLSEKESARGGWGVIFVWNHMRFTLKSHEIQSESHEIQSESHEISLTESMLDGTFTSFDEKWKRFSDQVNAQFNGNEGGRGLEGIDLNITFESHEIQSESHEIQNESHEIHSESHKIQSESHEIRKDLMRLIFESHLYGHPRHAMVARVKHTIPKLKWKTKENFYDWGIFTMLHMENFNGGPAFDFDCGLPVESQLQLDILRRLRFKFATKILLHEINLQSEKMVEFAKVFDKKGPSEKISVIIDAIKNREERDRIDN